MANQLNRLWRTSILVTACLISIGAGMRSQAQSEKVAALVNNEIITEQEFYERLQRMHGQDFIIQGNPPQMRGETAGQIILGSLISERLIVQTAAKESIAPTDADIDAEYNQIAVETNIAAALKAGVVTKDSLKYDIRVQRSRFNLATKGISLTPDQVQEYYSSHIVQYTIPQKWTIAIIRTTKMEDVDKISADLKSGKPFAEIVKTYSDDEASKAHEGNLGEFSANDTGLPGPILDAIKPLKVGSVSEPVLFALEAGANKPKVPAWWFIKLTAMTPESKRPFSSVKSQVERFAMLDKAKGYTAADAKITEFRKESEIVVNLKGYEGLAKERGK